MSRREAFERSELSSFQGNWRNQSRVILLHLLIGCAAQLGICVSWGADAPQTTNNISTAVASPDGESPNEQAQSQPEEDERTWRGEELGPQRILQSRPRPRMFYASSDTQYIYDSNVLLADGDFIQVGDDWVFIQDFGASFSPPLIEPLVSTLYYHHNLTRFNDFSQFDFDADWAGLHLAIPAKALLTVYGDFSACRYYYRNQGHEFYKYYNTELGIAREQRLSRRASLTYGYQLDWRPASPSELTRIDNALYLGASFALIDRLTAQFFYRIRPRVYYQANRTDLDNVLNLSLVYSLNDYISARVSATYGVNNSTAEVRDYNVFSGGVGLNLSIRF